MLLVSLLGVLGISDPPPLSFPLQMFLVTTAVTAAIGGINQLKIQSTRLTIVLHLAAEMLIVYALGGWVFHFAPTSGPWLWLLVLINLVIYGGVCGALAMRTRADAEHINEQIRRRNRRQKEASHDTHS